MALTNKLTAIADAIREKTGTTDLLTLDAMPTAISGITGGEGGGTADLPEEALVISGNCTHRFANGGWDWFIENYGNNVTTDKINNAGSMFYKSKVEEIPFELNFIVTSSSTAIGATDMLRDSYVKTIPKINNIRPSTTSYMLSSCMVRVIPDDIDANWDWSYIDNNKSGYNGDRSESFSYCYSLRSFPMSYLNHGNPVANYSCSIYTGTFEKCYVLDEVIGIPFPHKNATWTSNAFSNFVSYCCRLKNITFALQEDNTPYVVNWKGQTIDISPVGYGSPTYISYVLNYNSGITADKEVKDDASYQALKDNPDWFTFDIKYSRYNHDSAVNTINSLPDTSAYITSGGTNTIKFKGAAGSATGGGAINTLTEEEIAVATAKGWTVTFT